MFAHLTDDDLERLATGIERVDLPSGETVFEEGDPGELAYVICGGDLEVVKVTEGREVLLAVRGPGDVIGEMALLDAAPRTATVRARTNVTLLAVPKETLDALIDTSPNAIRALFQVLLDRWKQTESRIRQSQRMAQLGTLTAGLAHEMNNPAGAIHRSAGQLVEAVEEHEAALAEAITAGPDVVSDERFAGLLAPSEPVSLSPLERSDREAAIEQVLAEAGTERPWELASDLVGSGVEAGLISALVADHGAGTVAATLRALAAGRRLRLLAGEVGEAASRLSAIVSALKSYSYLDRAPVQQVDVRRGLDDTLMILAHQLADIEVATEYSEDTPVIEAYAPELNQVWTNLLDNAADALTEAAVPDPRIVVRSRPADDGGVVVEVEDNGPGVPTGIQAKVFDPFFTTKAPGVGTGLGLDISYRIVVHEHRGEIILESAPGRTVFRVILPATVSQPAGD